MANPASVNDQMNEEIIDNYLKEKIYTGEVSRSGVKNPFTGKEITKKATYKLPVLQDLTEATSQFGMSEREIMYWLNYGLRTAARAQVFASLSGLDLGDEKVNELFKAFNQAMDSMSSPDMSAERKQKIQDFVLSEPKFEPLKEPLAALAKDSETPIEYEFKGISDIKKSSGKKGRPAGSAKE